MKRIIILVNSPLFVLQHLEPIINNLKTKSKLYIICPYDKKYPLKNNNYKVIHIPFRRDPSIIDLFSLLFFNYYRISIKPNICLSFTPKAGIINSLTCFSFGKNYHYFTGQRWALYRGFKRVIFKAFDKLILVSSVKVFCDSFSQLKYINEELKINKVKVIGSGSISGVNLNKFNNHNSLTNIKKALFKIPLEDNLKKYIKNYDKKKSCLFGFIGRLNKDKGIFELLKSFEKHIKEFPNSYLILIGPNELKGYPQEKLIKQRNIFYLNFSKNVNLFLPLFRALILPSFREGFGSVVIEAGACSIPSIVSDIPGPNDFVKHLLNGYLIRPGDIESIKTSLDYFVINKKKAIELGSEARKLVVSKYEEKHISNLFIKEILKS